MAAQFLIMYRWGVPSPPFFASHCCACSDTLDEMYRFLCRHSLKSGFLRPRSVCPTETFLYHLFIQMYIQMWISHFDVLFRKNNTDLTGDGLVHIPVIFGFDPNANGISDGAVAVI